MPLGHSAKLAFNFLQEIVIIIAIVNLLPLLSHLSQPLKLIVESSRCCFHHILFDTSISHIYSPTKAAQDACNWLWKFTIVPDSVHILVQQSFEPVISMPVPMSSALSYNPFMESLHAACPSPSFFSPWNIPAAATLSRIGVRCSKDLDHPPTWSNGRGWGWDRLSIAKVKREC